MIVVLVVLAVMLLKPNDDTPLEETDYYPKTMKHLVELKPDGGYGTPLECGWSKANITPNFEIYIAGYGKHKTPSEGIHDSIYVRSFVFNNGRQKVAMISLDLMIVPPMVVKKVMPQLEKLGFKRSQVYLGATHSHSSAGGWAEGLGGAAFAGKYNEKLVNLVSKNIIESVKKATDNLSACKIGFQQIDAADLVVNRLFGEKFPEDPWLRLVIIEKENKESALLITYSAHATCVRKKDNKISCDYPGMLVKNLEEAKVCDFAAFYAGAVGSMKPKLDTALSGFAKAEFLAVKLKDRVIQHKNEWKADTSSYISSAYLPIAMHEPQLRINNYLSFRPWVFNKLMGKQQIGINALQLGNVIFIGTPCDYSGELVKQTEQIAKKQNHELLITSFNGAYVGYITPDKYYDSVRAEIREMNWFGPHNGRYFSEVVDGLVKKQVSK